MVLPSWQNRPHPKLYQALKNIPSSLRYFIYSSSISQVELVTIGSRLMGGNRTNQNSVDQRFNEIASKVPRASMPRDENLPAWLLDGIEHLEAFFSATAEVWDEKFGDGGEVDPFYAAVVKPIRATTEKVTLLDVGCGTGLELKYVFQKAPQAQITGIDLADGMLERLEGKFRNRMDQITLIRGNCLDVEFGEGVFDYAISTLALHHLPPPNRKVVYDKILQSLKPDGCFVEGDQSAPPGDRFEDDDIYHNYIARLPDGARSGWNYDITLSLDEHKALLREAGFRTTELLWESRKESGLGVVVLLAR